jgi:hypothetical protein
MEQLMKTSCIHRGLFIKLEIFLVKAFYCGEDITEERYKNHPLASFCCDLLRNNIIDLSILNIIVVELIQTILRAYNNFKNNYSLEILLERRKLILEYLNKPSSTEFSYLDDYLGHPNQFLIEIFWAVNLHPFFSYGDDNVMNYKVNIQGFIRPLMEKAIIIFFILSRSKR